MRPGDGCQLTAAQTTCPCLRLEEEAAGMCRREGCEVSAARSVTRGVTPQRTRFPLTCAADCVNDSPGFNITPVNE